MCIKDAIKAAYEKFYFQFWWAVGIIPASIYALSSDLLVKFGWVITAFYILVLGTALAFLLWITTLFLGMIFFEGKEAIRNRSLRSAFAAVWLVLGLISFLFARCGQIE